MLGEIVNVWTGLAADLEQIAKPAGGDQSGRRAFSFEQCIGSDGRAQADETHLLGLPAGLFQDLANTVDRRLMRSVRRRGELVAEGIAGTIVDHEQVGEGAADIDSDAQRSCHEYTPRCFRLMRELAAIMPFNCLPDRVLLRRRDPSKWLARH